MPTASVAVELPQTVLKGVAIAPAVLEIIPLPTAEKFQVLAFFQDDSLIKLAVVHPEQLKQGFYDALKQIGEKLHKKIELYRTDAASFQEVIGRYRQYVKDQKKTPSSGIALDPASAPKPVPQEKPAPLAPSALTPPPIVPAQSKAAVPVPPPPAPSNTPTKVTVSSDPQTIAHGWPKVPPPPLFELGKLVAYNYLRRVPYEFATKERLLSVDFLKPSTYWFVTDGTNDSRLKKATQYIAESNHITIHVMVINPKDFNDLLDYYKTLSSQETEIVHEKQKEEDEKVLREEEEAIERKLQQLNTPIEEDVRPVHLAKDVIVPGIQAQILTTQEEKKGLAGFIQHIAQNFAAQETEKTTGNQPFTPPQEVPAAPIPVTQVVPAPSVSSPPPGNIPVPPPPVPAVAASSPSVPQAPAAPAVSIPIPATPSSPAPSVTAKPAASPTAAKKNEETDDIGKLLDKHVESLDDLKSIIRGGVIPRIVAAIVSYAIHEKSSDIHIEAYEDEVRVRYRIDGQLIDIVKLPPDIHNPMVSRIKILSKLRLDENRVPQDGRFDVNFDETTQVDVRISIMPTVHGEKVVMRILDKSRGVTSLEKLGIEGIAYERLTQAIQKPYGICLATGPTGSGKSTSLYAILSRIATPNVNVVTLEDPIEYEMKGINQSQIRPKIGYTFAEGLRSILRQDPNIIMVGEIRDGETANMATQAALTGHLVLSTLHTNDAAGAIPRLNNMGIEPFLITSSLNVVMAQRLVRKICPDCRREISLPEGIKKQFSADIEAIAGLNEIDARRIKRPITFYQGSGCSSCNGKGYKGRMGIYEVLVMSDEIADLTVTNAPSSRILEAARKDGMLTLYQDGLLKAITGVTTIDEVLRESSSK